MKDKQYVELVSDDDARKIIEELTGDLADEFKSLRASDRKRNDEIEAKLTRRMDALDVMLQGGAGRPSGGVVQTDGGPFVHGAETKMAPYFSSGPLPEEVKVEEVRLGALLAGMAFGQHVFPYMREEEQKTFLTTPGASGGFVVPDAISARFVDEVRNRTRVLQSGAVSFPMKANVVNLPALEGTSAGWRGEGDAFPDAGGQFRNRVLSAKMVAASSEFSIEVLEDAGADGLDSLSALLEDAQAKAMAEALDLAALIGSGSTQPTGLLNIAGVTKTPLTAAPSDYAFLASAIGRARSDNFEPNAAIYSARTAEALDLLTDTTGQPLRPPASVAGIEHLISNQVPDDLGAGTNESLAFVAEWDRVVIGFRPEMTVRTQVDPYSNGANGMVRLRSYMRADVVLLDDGAVEIVSEILP